MHFSYLRYFAWLLLGAALPALSGCSYVKGKTVAANDVLSTSSGYHAVLLSSGQVYFGKLEGLDSPHPVLRDVFYVQSTQDPDSKEVRYVLVKRGKEAHAPDRMILNPQHIILVEPVNQNSKVAELIASSRTAGM